MARESVPSKFTNRKSSIINSIASQGKIYLPPCQPQPASLSSVCVAEARFLGTPPTRHRHATCPPSPVRCRNKPTAHHLHRRWRPHRSPLPARPPRRNQENGVPLPGYATLVARRTIHEGRAETLSFSVSSRFIPALSLTSSRRRWANKIK